MIFYFNGQLDEKFVKHELHMIIQIKISFLYTLKIEIFHSLSSLNLSLASILLFTIQNQFIIHFSYYFLNPLLFYFYFYYLLHYFLKLIFFLSIQSNLMHFKFYLNFIPLISTTKLTFKKYLQKKCFSWILLYLASFFYALILFALNLAINFSLYWFAFKYFIFLFLHFRFMKVINYFFLLFQDSYYYLLRFIISKFIFT